MSMRTVLLIASGIACVASVPKHARAQPVPGWTLARVVIVMRHGIRPPTKALPLPPIMTSGAWPGWDVGWGELTRHGARVTANIASYDRAGYAGLIGKGCPKPADARFVADSDQRTLATARVYADTMFPGCDVSVEHVMRDTADPRFSPFQAGPDADGAAMLAAAQAALPAGGMARIDADQSRRLARVTDILGCGTSACDLKLLPSSLQQSQGRVMIAGALAIAASLSETLLLEYAEGKPLAEVGWGRADVGTISDLSTLHALEFAIVARPLAIAQSGSAALRRDIHGVLSAAAAPRFTLMVGHDTNLAYLAGALGLHWQVPGFAADDPPPGGALIFELWTRPGGERRVTVRFRSPTLDEMRSNLLLGNDSRLLCGEQVNTEGIAGGNGRLTARPPCADGLSDSSLDAAQASANSGH